MRMLERKLICTIISVMIIFVMTGCGSKTSQTVTEKAAASPEPIIKDDRYGILTPDYKPMSPPTISIGEFITKVKGEIVKIPDIILENSVMKCRIGFAWSTGEVSEIQSHIVDFIIKGNGIDQAGAFMDSSAGRTMINHAEIIEETPISKTLYLKYGGGSRTEITIYADSPVLKINYLSQLINNVDLCQPGGILKRDQGVYAIYGDDKWHRETTEYHENAYFCVDPDDVNNPGVPNVKEIDPLDGGPLNYNGSFILGVFNPENGVGFGRVVPIEKVDSIKLLWGQGFEIFPTLGKSKEVLLKDNTHFLFGVDGGGRNEIFYLGSLLAEGQIPVILLENE